MNKLYEGSRVYTRNTTICRDKETEDLVVNYARGNYQVSLIRGNASWCGSDIRGKAKNYANKYRESRNALLDRLRNDMRLRVSRGIGIEGQTVIIIERVTR
jgi:hypothetical protein